MNPTPSTNADNPKVPLSDIVNPNMSPEADAAVQGAMERAAEDQARVSTNADELPVKALADELESIWHNPTRADRWMGIAQYIQAHYLPKDKVRAAIGEDEPIERENAHIDIEREGKNALRHELRRALGLEEE